MAEIKIAQAESKDKERWDEYVVGNPDVSPYHMFAWKKSVENAYGHSAYYLVAEEGRQIRGVLPLIYIKPPFLEGHLVSLPYCDLGDILADNNLVKKKLLLTAVDIAEELKARCIDLRSHEPPEGLDYLKASTGMQSHKVSMLMKLPGSSKLLWNNFKSKLRSQLRKAGENMLVFKWGEIKDLDAFYEVFCRNMRDLGSPVHSKKWFAEILINFAENVRMGLVFHNSALIAVGIVMHINTQICIPWASTLRKFNSLSPNMFLYWNILKYSADNGFTTFDFGRSTPDDGTYKFKSQWGARPVQLYWSSIYPGHTRVNKSHLSGSTKRDVIANVWSKLPVSVTKSLGPQIRKYISL